MSVISIDLGSKPVNRAGKLWRFRHTLGEWLDALVAYPIKNAVSGQELRWVDEDIKRCRELISKSRYQEADTRFHGMRPTRVVRAIKFR